MIVNLRGCSGAGKSYPGFRLLEEFGPPIEEIRTSQYFGRTKPKLIAQVLPGGLCLAGRYTMQKSTVKDSAGYSGGVDGFFPVAELDDMLQKLADTYPHMLFESLMISGTKQRWFDFGDRNKQDGFVFGTLDTPLELSLERVKQRNGGKEINVPSIEKHRRAVYRCHRNFEKMGGDARLIDHTRSYEEVRDLFLNAGWDPHGAAEAPRHSIYGTCVDSGRAQSTEKPSTLPSS